MSYRFNLMVYVQRRPHMRDENLEYHLHMGFGVLKQVFDEERVDANVTEVTFFYPERWMNIVEERSLFDRLDRFCPNLQKVTIVTQSVYIIQCTPNGSVKISTSKDERDQIEETGGLVQEAPTGKLWYENVFVRDFSKLQVM